MPSGWREKQKKRQTGPYGRKTEAEAEAEANKIKVEYNSALYNSAQYLALQNKVSSGASTINDYNIKTVIQVVLKKVKNNKNNEYDW